MLILKNLVNPVYNLDPVHGVEKILALRVNPHPELLPFTPQSIFQLRRTFTRARGVNNNHHREFSLHDSLVDVDDTATRRRQYLRHACDDPRMVQTEYGNDHARRRALGDIQSPRTVSHTRLRLNLLVDIGD